MDTPRETVRRFITSDGYTFFHLDGVWRDSLAHSLADMAADGDEDGPVGIDGPLWGTLDVVRPALRIEWLDGPRKGQVVEVPMKATPGLVDVGGRKVTGWQLASGIAPDWVTQALEYGLNEGPEFEGSRFLPDEIGDETEIERTDSRPNLEFRVVFLPTDVAPVTVGGKELEETAAAVRDFLHGPAF